MIGNPYFSTRHQLDHFQEQFLSDLRRVLAQGQILKKGFMNVHGLRGNVEFSPEGLNSIKFLFFYYLADRNDFLTRLDLAQDRSQ